MPVDIGRRIMQLREEKGYSVEDVADEIDFGGRNRRQNTSKLEKIEEGRLELTYKQTEDLAEFFDKPIAFFIDNFKDDSTKGQAPLYRQDVFISKLKKLVKEDDNLALRRLDEHIGLHGTALSSYLTGANIPSVASLKRICDYFDVPKEYFDNPIKIEEIDREHYYSSRDIAKLYGFTPNGASSRLSKFKKKYPKKVLVVRGNEENNYNFMNMLEAKYWTDFCEYVPEKYTNKKFRILDYEDEPEPETDNIEEGNGKDIGNEEKVTTEDNFEKVKYILEEELEKEKKKLIKRIENLENENNKGIFSRLFTSVASIF